MARLGKDRLMGLVRAAIEAGGWTAMPLSGPKEHPFRFEMTKGGVRHLARVYIWNMTHGGGAKRPRGEFRIQITRVERFEPEPGGVTLILGWSEDFGVFGAFDIAHHSGLLGNSPSIQIGRAALEEAGRSGMAVQPKGNREVAVAVRADHLASYVNGRDQAHRGDLTGLLLADNEIDFEALAHRSGRLNFGGANEREQREMVLERIAALEREIEAIKPQIGLIGHNRPPEAIESDLGNSVEDIRSEMAAEEPNVGVIGARASLLQRIWKALRSARDEGRRLASEVGEKAREKAAEVIVGGVVAAGAFYGREVIDAIGSVLSAIGRWFAFVL